ncbi:MAG: bifunctional glutamate N-acetyltransferase/amino-acid acetyltransferase ArgJ [Deltaproteobacteria bacterium]|nr:bifunctional glutamate N-acetyltransferase/amino-acid acetyltransferase ArgJ [Deltaproteobacteria bacterium]
MIVPGFTAAGAAAGIKKHGGLDLALIVADTPAAAAGVFTTNRVKAAPVLITRARLRNGQAQAVLINSGNANACTGAEGLGAARHITGELARLLSLRESLVLPASTGVIGQPLPVPKIIQALPGLVGNLRPEGLPEAARAIMTTDTRPKTAYQQGQISGAKVTVAGIAKGAGMIHPDMATLLVFICTDAAVSPDLLKTSLKAGAEQSFNRITIDGDTSTNDMALLLASGKAGNGPWGPGSPASGEFQEMLVAVMQDLARQVVADGEGVTRVFRILVQGAATPKEARQAAATIATSPLVKTAMAGADVNWGRLMAALGRSGARFDPAAVDIAFGGHPVVKSGQGLGEQAEAAARELILAGPFTITIDLHKGRFSDHYDTCDLTEDYIKINASYRS